MSLIFLRHSQPIGATGLCYGRTDLALGASFESDIKRLDETLPKLTAIVTSPLSRCLRLAERLAERRNLRVAIDSDLIEMDFGTWENRAWNDIPRAELDAWANDFFAAKPHGGESVNDLLKRTKRALAKPRDGSTLWVSHAGVYRAVQAHLDQPDPWNAKLAFATFATLPTND